MSMASVRIKCHTCGASIKTAADCRPGMVEDDFLLHILLPKVKEKSQKALAKELGISESYLSDILNGRRCISEEVAKRLGYERQVRFYFEEKK